MNDTNPWKILATKTAYENPWMRVQEDTVITPNGDKSIYGFVESKDSVMIVVLNDERNVYLIRTFSYPSASWSWELPGGGGDGEEAEIASKRELAEETGIIAQSWTQLGSTRVCNGLMTERMATYLAQDLTFGEKIASDDKDLISEGKFFSLDEIDEMIASGEIDDGQSITGLYLFERWSKHQ